ncbi:MAG: hypothetical protein J5689_02780 [Clostridia bacterium]|nr:hypothetical protein [Clostridia bacterium]
MLKDLIYLASFYLNLDDVSDYLTNIEDDTEAEAPADVSILINLANLAIRRIVKDYRPIYREEFKSSDENCFIPFSALSKEVCAIKNVTTLDRLPVTFRILENNIKVGVPSGDYLVKYSYYPSELTDLGDSLVLPDGVSNEAVCFCMCCDYLTIKRLYDDADVFESKFKESLVRGLKANKDVKVASRGWF